MARDDSWAQVLQMALPILDRARPSGVLGWAGPVAPVFTRAAVGAGHWAAGRRRRALAAWTSAAGYGLGAWGLGTGAPSLAPKPRLPPGRSPPRPAACRGTTPCSNSLPLSWATPCSNLPSLSWWW